MLSKNRQTQILAYIEKQKSATVHELIEMFQVSDMTIRRDLNKLEQLGRIKRIHGGAVLPENHEVLEGDLMLSVRRDRQMMEKNRIANYAVSLIGDREAVILDAGTTTLYIAMKLLQMENITVITNGVNIAHVLLQNPKIEVIVTGGDLRHSTGSLVGPLAAEFLQRFKVDKAFIACSGISIERGLMNSNMVEGEIKHHMMDIAGEVIVVADHTKFESNFFNSFADLQEVDRIITSNGLSQENRDAFSRIDGLRVIEV